MKHNWYGDGRESGFLTSKTIEIKLYMYLLKAHLGCQHNVNLIGRYYALTYRDRRDASSFHILIISSVLYLKPNSRTVFFSLLVDLYWQDVFFFFLLFVLFYLKYKRKTASCVCKIAFIFLLHNWNQFHSSSVLTYLFILSTFLLTLKRLIFTTVFIIF